MSLTLYVMGPKDTIIVISHGGLNAAGIEAAMYAKERGVKVVVITSMENYRNNAPRHSSGKKLVDFADVAIDNGAPPEDSHHQDRWLGGTGCRQLDSDGPGHFHGSRRRNRCNPGKTRCSYSDLRFPQCHAGSRTTTRKSTIFIKNSAARSIKQESYGS